VGMALAKTLKGIYVKSISERITKPIDMTVDVIRDNNRHCQCSKYAYLSH